MMYPTQSSSIMRPKPVNKSRTGSQHPQWMRTLEEKYQRLHKKITENTNMMNLKFSHSRSLHDLRLSQAARYRDANTTRANTKSNNKGGSHAPVSLPTTNMKGNVDGIKSTVDQNGNCLQNLQITSNGIEDEQILTAEDMNELRETGNEIQAVLETGDKHSNASSESFYDYKSEEGAINDSDLNKNRVVISSPTENDMKIVDYDQDKTENVFEVNSRDLKTALSRASRKTVKSCPAQIQARSNLRDRQTTKSAALRSKSAHKSSDMFNKMSKEAHHAIKETVKEMNASRSKSCITADDDVEFQPSRHRKSVRTWIQPKSESKNVPGGYNATKILQSASDKMQHLIDCNAELLRPNSSQSKTPSSQSFNSSRGSGVDFMKKNSSKLPDIQNDSTKDKFTTKSQFYRLPGIGKYDVPVVQDSLFEITPPGFDSRYKDLEPVVERESETPPPDIRQRAIDKCSEWLTKYGNR